MPNGISSAADSNESAIKIPDHVLLRHIGKGSYGDVWLARNVIGTFRAVKIIRRESFDNASPFERELAGIKKFEPISRTHEGFLDVLQIGRNDEKGFFYYVMELADDLDGGQVINPDTYIPNTLGKSLARARRFPVEQCVQLGMALCLALEHLHRHSLVHRDIKPSNIVFVNGSPKLADIGLVTESNNAHSFVGTEGFIPPEGPGREQADIFSLGKSLYEIASGRDRLDFPALPAGLSEFPDGDQFLELNEVLIRACRQHPQNRYASAREMYEDLALLASGKSVRRLRVLENRWKSAKRSAGLVLGGLGIVAMIVFPLVREKQHAEEIRERQIGRHSANGIHKIDEGDYLGSLSDFAEIFLLEAKRKDRFSGNQSRIASILANSPKLTHMLFRSGRVGSVEFSRDGKQILSTGKEVDVRIHDLASGNVALQPVIPKLANRAVYSPDNNSVAIGDEWGPVITRNMNTGQTNSLVDSYGAVCLRYSPSGKWIAAGSTDKMIRIWEAETGALKAVLKGHADAVRSIAFNSGETLLVSGSSDRTARVWDWASEKETIPPLKHGNWVMDVAFSPDSTLIITGCHDRWARVWKTSNGEVLRSLMKHDDIVSQVAFSPDGMLILTASMDSTLRLWDGNTFMPLLKNQILRHSGPILSAAFNADGHQIVTGCADGSIRIWELAGLFPTPEVVSGAINDSGTMAAVILGESIQIRGLSEPRTTIATVPASDPIRELALSSDGKTVAAYTPDSDNALGSIKLWNVSNFESSKTIPITSKEKISQLAFSPDGSFFFYREGKKVRILETATAKEWNLSDGFRNDATVAFSSRHNRLAIGAKTKVFLFDPMQETPLFPEIVVPPDVGHLAFSPDGRFLLVSANDRAVEPRPAVLIDAEKGIVLTAELWHRDGVIIGAFRGDGQRMSTGGEDRDALLWSLPSPKEAIARLIHSDQVKWVTFSHDGRRLGTLSVNSARIWDAETGFPLTPPLECEKSPLQIVFLPDQSHFATVQSSTRFLLWKLPLTKMPPEDAVAIGHLLNSDLRPMGRPGAAHISRAWDSLSKKYPDYFNVTQTEIAQWHEERVRLATSLNLPAAVEFHSKKLAEHRRENPPNIENRLNDPRSTAQVAP